LALTEGWDEDDEREEGVWPENEEAVFAFYAVCTQFRVVAHFDGTTQRTGLDYVAAKVGLEQAEIAVTPELWSAIRCIEAGVLAADQGVEA
jgi:Phage related hypothetical protein (DUF1799)